MHQKSIHAYSVISYLYHSIEIIVSHFQVMKIYFKTGYLISSSINGRSYVPLHIQVMKIYFKTGYLNSSSINVRSYAPLHILVWRTGVVSSRV